MTKTFLYLLVVFSFFACKSKSVYIPIESVKTTYVDRYQRDSVYLHDSVFIRHLSDTVWMEKYRTIYRDRLHRDSVLIHDTIRVPYPVIETREVNRLRKWQIVLLCGGAISFGLLGYKIVRALKSLF